MDNQVDSDSFFFNGKSWKTLTPRLPCHDYPLITHDSVLICFNAWLVLKITDSFSIVSIPCIMVARRRFCSIDAKGFVDFLRLFNCPESCRISLSSPTKLQDFLKALPKFRGSSPLLFNPDVPNKKNVYTLYQSPFVFPLSPTSSIGQPESSRRVVFFFFHTFLQLLRQSCRGPRRTSGMEALPVYFTGARWEPTSWFCHASQSFSPGQTDGLARNV